MSRKPSEGHDAQHPAPHGATIYHWHGGLLMLTNSLYLDRPTAPIAATLRIALGEPYTIEVEGRVLTTRASLVGPKRCRNRITAVNSDMALFYLPIERPEYAGLRALLGKEAVVELPLETFDPVLARLRQIFNDQLSGSEVKALTDETLLLAAGSLTVTEEIDWRIRKVCDLLARTPLNQFDLEGLAKQVHMSASRLRSLFRQQIGYPIGEYARWSAMWQAVSKWRKDKTFTDVALEAGFFDLAHADRTCMEVFGMRPSLATDTGFVRLICCD
ncbi:MAG: AraC family transcriptional regulator [Pseudomonadota bacterium]